MRKLFAMFVAMCLLVVCFSAPAYGAEQNPDYKAIPGITQEEIEAIEDLKNSGRTFSYGALLSTESFLNEEGNIDGYTSELCKLLSELFDIEFVPSIYEWNDLIKQIANEELDFSGDLSLTPARMQDYFMSEVIAIRSISLFYRNGEPVLEIAKNRPPILGFLKDSAHQDLLVDAFGGQHEVEYLDSVEDVPAALKSGKIDAFVSNNIFEVLFKDDSSIASEVYSPLIFDSVSLATKNPDLEVIISVFNKYIQNGGRDALSSLYAGGLIEYMRYVFGSDLTDEEKAFIESHVSEGKKIPVALEGSNYPLCFYNETSGEFEGIVPDILKQITVITGLEFESIVYSIVLNQFDIRKPLLCHEKIHGLYLSANTLAKQLVDFQVRGLALRQ